MGKEEYPHEARYYDFVPRKDRNLVTLKCKYIECKRVVYMIKFGRKYFIRPHTEECPLKPCNSSIFDTPKKDKETNNKEHYGLTQSYQSRSEESNDSIVDINASSNKKKRNKKHEDEKNMKDQHTSNRITRREDGDKAISRSNPRTLFSWT